MVVFTRTRVRNTSVPGYLGTRYNIASGAFEANESYIKSNGSETCFDSGGNPKINGKYSPGSFFRTHKLGGYSVPSDIIQVSRYNSPGRKLYYNGRMIAGIPELFQDDISRAMNTEIIRNPYDADIFGARLLSKARPDKPALDLSQAIYELKDIPGLLRQRFLPRGLQGISDYYLALKFGWEPLLRDIRDFVSTTVNASALLDQLVRDEGKNVRRRVNLGSFRHQVDPVHRVGYSGIQSGLVTQAFASVPNYTDQTSVFKDTWGVASFRYTLPGGPRGYDWKARQLAKIYGLVPSPKTIYNIVPWSFLVDWFSGIGDYIDSQFGSSTVDELFTNFAFVMQHKRLSWTRSTSGTMVSPYGPDVPFSCSHTNFLESKERTVVDPFGPGFSGQTLDSGKQAILGALGLSNLPSNGPGYRRR